MYMWNTVFFMATFHGVDYFNVKYVAVSLFSRNFGVPTMFILFFERQKWYMYTSAFY